MLNLLPLLLLSFACSGPDDDDSSDTAITDSESDDSDSDATDSDDDTTSSDSDTSAADSDDSAPDVNTVWLTEGFESPTVSAGTSVDLRAHLTWDERQSGSTMTARIVRRDSPEIAAANLTMPEGSQAFALGAAAWPFGSGDRARGEVYVDVVPSMVAGTDYYATARAMVLSGAGAPGRAFVQIRPASAKLGLDSPDWPTTIAEGYQSLNGAQDTWAEYVVTYTAKPADAGIPLTLVFGIQSSPSDTAGTIVFDTVRVETGLP